MFNASCLIHDKLLQGTSAIVTVILFMIFKEVALWCQEPLNQTYVVAFAVVTYKLT